MATQPVYDKPVSVEEYLSMAFEHDCEFVDGVIEERDLGEFEHAYVQGILIGLFLNHRKEWGVFPLPEQRIQTQKAHFRVADIAILREGTKREGNLTHPPLLVIEATIPRPADAPHYDQGGRIPERSGLSMSGLSTPMRVWPIREPKRAWNWCGQGNFQFPELRFASCRKNCSRNWTRCSVASLSSRLGVRDIPVDE
jgi:hypothetical protein